MNKFSSKIITRKKGSKELPAWAERKNAFVSPNKLLSKQIAEAFRLFTGKFIVLWQDTYAGKFTYAKAYKKEPTYLEIIFENNSFIVNTVNEKLIASKNDNSVNIVTRFCNKPYKTPIFNVFDSEEEAKLFLALS